MIKRQKYLVDMLYAVFLPDQLPHLSVVKRRDLGTELCQFLTVGLRNQIWTHGENLPQFNKGGAQFFQNRA